jgi:endonuclease/exonuclease/phosphatase family metal-dependent hydrolase
VVRILLGGLLILSKHPIESHTSVKFASKGLPSALHHGDYWASKGFQLCLIKVPNVGTVRVINTHLIARYTSHGQEDGDDYVGVRWWLCRISAAPVQSVF